MYTATSREGIVWFVRRHLPVRIAHPVFSERAMEYKKHTNIKRVLSCVALLLALSPLIASYLLGAADETTPGMVSAMQAELSREMRVLGQQSTPAYFLSYEVTDTQSAEVTSSFGKL